MTLEQYEDMLNEQHGQCAICKTDTPGTARHGNRKSFAVDHCHETNEVRALLCEKCNQGLGCFRDDLTILEQALAYLRRHKTQ
jgi:recombination endonuclease VII